MQCGGPPHCGHVSDHSEIVQHKRILAVHGHIMRIEGTETRQRYAFSKCRCGAGHVYGRSDGYSSMAMSAVQAGVQCEHYQRSLFHERAP